MNSKDVKQRKKINRKPKRHTVTIDFNEEEWGFLQNYAVKYRSGDIGSSNPYTDDEVACILLRGMFRGFFERMGCNFSDFNMHDEVRSMQEKINARRN